MTEKKHPSVPGCVVRLTDYAVDDLQILFKAEPQIVRWALKKMIQIERDPNAGDPLLGGLIGYRTAPVEDADLNGHRVRGAPNHTGVVGVHRPERHVVDAGVASLRRRRGSSVSQPVPCDTLSIPDTHAIRSVAARDVLDQVIAATAGVES